jgi:hypothetical protein
VRAANTADPSAQGSQADVDGIARFRVIVRTRFGETSSGSPPEPGIQKQGKRIKRKELIKRRILRF